MTFHFYLDMVEMSKGYIIEYYPTLIPEYRKRGICAII